MQLFFFALDEEAALERCSGIILRLVTTSALLLFYLMLLEVPSHSHSMTLVCGSFQITIPANVDVIMPELGPRRKGLHLHAPFCSPARGSKLQNIIASCYRPTKHSDVVHTLPTEPDTL